MHNALQAKYDIAETSLLFLLKSQMLSPTQFGRKPSDVSCCVDRICYSTFTRAPLKIDVFGKRGKESAIQLST